MGEGTSIVWAHDTFNPWVGCQKVSPGCDNCYAEAWAKRSGQVEWGPHADRHRTSTGYWRKPLVWNQKAAASGQPRRVFCASLADVFDTAVPLEWVVDLLDLIRSTPSLTWMLLTKRPTNIRPRLSAALDAARVTGSRYTDLEAWLARWLAGHPPANVWLGTTVEAHLEGDRRIPELLRVPARATFLSCEPLLGPLDLTKVRDPKASNTPFNALSVQPGESLNGHRIDLVIAGGESGPGARPYDLSWARALRDQCAAAGVAFLHKQLGRYPTLQGKPLKHQHPKGEDMAEWPEDLRVQQIPEHLHAP